MSSNWRTRTWRSPQYVVVRCRHGLSGGFDRSYWTIFLLDLGVVVPATILAGLELIRGTHVGHTALYAFLGWYALVAPSVATMAAVMVINDDPDGSLGQVVLLGSVAMVFALLTAWMYRPFFAPDRTAVGVRDGSGDRHAPGHAGAAATRDVG